jgi:hypothetical protein
VIAVTPLSRRGDNVILKSCPGGRHEHHEAAHEANGGEADRFLLEKVLRQTDPGEATSGLRNIEVQTAKRGSSIMPLTFNQFHHAVKKVLPRSEAISTVFRFDHSGGVQPEAAPEWTGPA